MGGWIHTFTLDPINAGTAQIMANIHIKAAIITVASVVRLPVTPVNISNKNQMVLHLTNSNSSPNN